MRPEASVGGLFLFIAAMLAAAPPRSPQTTIPTFAKDVAPILYKRCAMCHRPGEIAPMPLLTYEDARSYASDIREQVAAGHMPPWQARAPAGTFLNGRLLP